MKPQYFMPALCLCLTMFILGFMAGRKIGFNVGFTDGAEAVYKHVDEMKYVDSLSKTGDIWIDRGGVWTKE